VRAHGLGGDEVIARHAAGNETGKFVSKSLFDSIPDAVAELARPGDSRFSLSFCPWAQSP